MGATVLSGAGISIAPATPDQIPGIVQLHQATLGYSLNSRLGSEHLHYLYARLMAHPASLVAAASVNGSLAGVVSATLDLKTLTPWIYAGLNPGGWAAYAIRMLVRPGIWPLAWEAAHTPHTLQWQGETVRPCLTVITVAPESRQLGVGRALVEAVDNFVWHNQQATYWLETLTTNKTAQAFYARLGFVIVGQHRTTLYLARRCLNPNSTPES